MRILVMGLPGSGKTTLAELLHSTLIDSDWLNADDVRSKHNDWDFSEEGRIRQAKRLRALADGSEKCVIITDFIAPNAAVREIFNADFTIWMDTIESSRYEDTNKVFMPPSKYDIRVTSKNAEVWAEVALKAIKRIMFAIE